MTGEIASKAQGYTPVGAIASALAALSAADASLSASVASLTSSVAGKANLSGGNTFTGSQTVASGSSFVATNAGDWAGVEITGTGLTGKDTSNATKWSLNSATGVITAVGSGLTSIPNSATTATSANTASAIVARDSNGDFTARNITSTANFVSVIDRSGGTLFFQESSSALQGTSITAVNMASFARTNTSGATTAVSITPTYNQASGTAANTDLLINRTQTAVGSGAQLLFDAQVGGVSKASINSAGVLTAVGGNFNGVGIGSGAVNYGYNSLYLANNGTFNANTPLVIMATGQITTTSGTSVGVSIAPTYNQTSGAAANTDLLINRTQTAVGSGAQLLIDAQVGGSSKFNLSNTGRVVTTNTVQLASIDTGSVAGTVARQICTDTTTGKLNRWNGSSWVQTEA